MSAETGASRFVYVTYIRSTPEAVWTALVTPDFMRRYWFGAAFETDWAEGSRWRLIKADGQLTDEGTILEFEPPRRLLLAWTNHWKPEARAEGEARCLMELEPAGEAVKLTITHSIQRENSLLISLVSGGWPRILSNLKSLLETGEIALSSK